MGWSVRKLFAGCSPNSLLSYSTVKIVQINDWRLGLLHYFFMLCVIAYVVGYVVIFQKRYLLLQPPVGSIRTSLMSHYTNETLIPEKIPYCLPNPTYRGYANHDCRYYDDKLTLYPIAQTQAMFISTRISKIEQSSGGCNFTMPPPNCTYTTVDNTTEYFYVADVESFTVMLEHSMYVNRLNIEATSYELTGILYNKDGDRMKIPSDSQVGKKDTNDIMTVRLLLQAAGIDLDAPTYDKTETLRNSGIVLLVFITYSNTYSYNTNNLRYEYTVKAVTRAEFKAEQAVYTKKISDRVIWNRHGIRLIFIQTGMLGKFDFQTLLLNFVSGLGLVAVSTLIVDIIALRLLPSTSRLYRKYKYEEADALRAIERVSLKEAYGAVNPMNEEH